MLNQITLICCDKVYIPPPRTPDVPYIFVPRCLTPANINVCYTLPSYVL